jgi:hypothetical protein
MAMQMEVMVVGGVGCCVVSLWISFCCFHVDVSDEVCRIEGRKSSRGSVEKISLNGMRE